MQERVDREVERGRIDEQDGEFISEQLFEAVVSIDNALGVAPEGVTGGEAP
jgi:hypothetical protein